MRRREFFERVPQFFDRGNRLAWERYEETLFNMTRPVSHGNYHRIHQFVGGNPPIQALRDVRPFHELDRVLSKARYPRAGQLARLEEFADDTAEFATALLHFNNPAYPIFDAATVRALHAMGSEIAYDRSLTAETVDAYQAYIDLIQELKDEVPYYCVPEKNYYLTRIVQLSLWELGRELMGANGERAAAPRTAARNPA